MDWLQFNIEINPFALINHFCLKFWVHSIIRLGVFFAFVSSVNALIKKTLFIVNKILTTCDIIVGEVVR